MADRYWVGAAGGNWNAQLTNWATTDGGVGGAPVPTAADDVYLTALSNNVNIGSANGSCRSLNCTGFTGTLTLNSGIELNIGTSTPGPSNIALKFSPTMTFVGTNAINFISTSSTQQDIDFAGKATGHVAFNAASNGSWRYLGSHTITAGTLTLTRGSLDVNGQTVSWRTFSSASGQVRSLTLGAANISITGVGINVGWILSTSNLTLSAGSSTINMTGTNAEFQGGGATYGTVVFSGSNTGSHSITGANTFGALTITGTAIKICSITLAANQTVTGIFTVNGNSAINRVLVASNTIGTARTISAATVVTSNSDWRDITGSGAGSWNLAAITGNSGDCGGNSGITFTSPTTQTATGTASFTWSTHGWTSRVPLPQDTANIPNAFSASQTVTMDMPRFGTVSFAGSTGNISFTVTSSESYGHITMRTGMGTISMSNINFYGAAQQNITTAGNTWVGAPTHTIGRSRLQLQDTWTTVTTSLVTSGAGNIDTQGFNFTGNAITTGNTSNTNQFSTSTFTLGSVGTPITLVAARVSAASATFILSGVSGTTRTANLGASSIGSLTYAVASSSGDLSITGNNTINNLTIGQGRRVTFTAGSSTTLTGSLTFNGTVLTPGYLLSTNSSPSATVPSSSAFVPTTEVEIVARVSNSDWTPATSRYIFGRQGNSASNGNFLLGVSNATSGALFLYHSNGTTATTSNSTAVPPLVDGTTYWVKATWRKSDGRIQFFYAADQVSEPVSWTQVGANVTGATTDMNASPNANVEIGGNATLPRIWSGNIYRVILRKTIGGAADFDADFTAKAWGADTITESSANAAVVTLVSGESLGADGATRLGITSGSTAATISKTSGTVSVTNASISYSTAAGGATFNALDSYNSGNNTGWNFIASSNGNFLQLF